MAGVKKPPAKKTAAKKSPAKKSLAKKSPAKKSPVWARAVTHLTARDQGMPMVVARHGAPTLPTEPTRDPLQSLGRAIVYQQLSGAAAGTIYGRFVARYPGKKFPRAPHLLATAHADLRAVGLSNAKAAALLDLARHVVEKRVVPSKLHRMTDDEIMEALLPVRGIGPWSVHMFLMFALGRPDVLPTGDLGVKKGMQRHFGLNALPTAEEMEALTESWRPYRTAGCWYMWRVADDDE